MFNVNRFLSRPQKIILEQNFKNYLNDSINKYNKLTIETNKKNKTKKAIESILNETSLTVENNLTNCCKFNNFFILFSVVSIGALIFYKNK